MNLSTIFYSDFVTNIGAKSHRDIFFVPEKCHQGMLPEDVTGEFKEAPQLINFGKFPN